MKVFEVITEHCLGPDPEVIRTVQYVTSQADTLKSVADYFTDHCVQYEKSLLCVKEVLTLTEHIMVAPEHISAIPEAIPHTSP